MIYLIIVILAVLIYLFLKSENLFQEKWYKFAIIAVFLMLAGITTYSFSDDINSIIYLTATTLLFISVLTDIHDKTLPIEYYVSIIPMLIVKAVIIPESFFGKQLLFNLLTIVILVIIGFIFRASLGFGDILLFATLTMLIGYGVTVVLILMGLVFTSVLGLIMIAMRKANRRTQLPFTPFILAGFIIFLLI